METRDLLKAISKSAAVLFRDKDLESAIRKTLRNLGQATGVSRVYIFENHTGPRSELLTSQRYEWVAPGITPQINNPTMQNIRGSRFPAFREHLRKKTFCSLVKDLSPSLRKLLDKQQVLSVAMVPIYANKLWYGFIGFDDCVTQRRWTRAEIETLEIAASILGGAIERRQDEEKLRSILEEGIDSLGTGLFILDRDFRVVWVNREMENYFGVSRSRIMGRDKRRFIREKIKGIIVEHEEFKKRVLATYKNNTYIEQFKCEVKPGRGRKGRILQHWSTPIRRGSLAGGRIEHYTDITDVEQATAALRLSEKKYRNLVEKMNEGLNYADENGVVKYANESFCRMLGFQLDEIVGRNIGSFLGPEGKRILNEQRALRRKGHHSRYEMSMRSKDGEMVPLEVSAAPSFDDRGRFRGSYAVFTDIRERKKLEQMKDDLLRDASHELKAPIAKMKMGLDTIKRCLEGDISYDERLGVKMIESEVDRIRKNVEALTDLSAFESGRVRLKKDKIDICMLIREVITELGSSAQEKGISIRFSEPKGGLILRCDRERIYHLLRNLLENAVKFSKGGTIHVSVRHRANEILASVTDEGRGIECIYLNRIFERHYQRYASDPGTGLGLTLSKKIVELHGGRIWADSKGRGKGMKVTVALPLAGK